MKAILVKEPGDASQLTMGEAPDPQPGPGELLVKVAYTALNRADIVQREGNYPPPEGASPILGLEIAGEVIATGPEVTRHAEGDKVFGLVPGGGYAEKAVIHEDMAIALPSHLGLQEAAAVPEVFLTAYQALVWIGHAQQGETVLVHAGASGVGTAATQLARSMDMNILVTASARKHELCRSLGATACYDYHKGPFTDFVKEHTEGKGADIIIDFIGAPYFSHNLDSLARDGRLVMLAFLGGVKANEVNLRRMLAKRLTIAGSTLRSRDQDYQIRLNMEMTAYLLPLLEQGEIKPVVDSTFSWRDVADAHRYMEDNRNQGKIILAVD
ncbi:NAD(P)H-quinone oxidoreductase [Roseivirga sp. BDSF3-8]|uniref:NAD(P)H-quinone oxidoreductase n=1 Tax=Roseivirga sp. BDSF3-8 TaxID=3241598 RepID=UPI003531B5EE